MLQTVGWRTAGHGAAIFIDFTEGHRSLGTFFDESRFTRAALRHANIREKGPSLEWNLTRSNFLISAVPTLHEVWGQISGGDWKTRSDAPAETRGDLPGISIELQRNGQNYLLTYRWVEFARSSSTIELQERESVVDSGASVHMVSR